METAVKQRVKQIIESKGMTINSLASTCGVPQSNMCKQITGDTALSAKTILAILNGLPTISAEWLLRGKGSMELSMMDRLAMKLDGGCGCGNDSIFDNEIHNSTVQNGDGGYKALADNLQKRCESLEEQNKSLIEIINNLSKK